MSSGGVLGLLIVSSITTVSLLDSLLGGVLSLVLLLWISITSLAVRLDGEDRLLGDDLRVDVLRGDRDCRRTTVSSSMTDEEPRTLPPRLKHV